MNETDVALFWESQAEGRNKKDKRSDVSDALAVITVDSADLQRGTTEAVARAVARRFCPHGATPPLPLPDIKNLGERRVAAQQHPGLCGVHHAQ